MRLTWATDVHLNFVDEAHVRNIFCATISKQQPDALLLGGDLAEAPSLLGWLAVLADALPGLPIYFVLGNHDYYHGEIAAVRSSVRQLTATSPRLRWLPAAGPIPLTDTATLVGHGGWGDGRLGDFLATPIRLNDHRLIAELTGHPRPALLQRLRALGDEAAAHLRADITAAIQGGARRLVVLTHVPPFLEACWHEGATPAPDSPWVPDFTCGATGGVLRTLAERHPGVDFTVLCGHTHGAGTALIQDNLRVRTGAADYGSPGIAGTVDL